MVIAVDVVGFLNDITGGQLLAWKVAVTTFVFALAGLQVAMAARFWGVGGFQISPQAAVAVHRWSGRVLLVGAVAVALACLFGPAGATSPTRVVLHTIFGSVLFAALVVKFVLLKFSRSGQSWLPAAGIVLFLSFFAVWATSVADYVSAR
jgi:hypothetical protein